MTEPSATEHKSAPLVWVLVDDRPGNTNQSMGVADALGWGCVTKNVTYTLLAQLPNMLRGASLAGIAPESRALLDPPWPDVVIAAGRRLGPVARWIKSAAMQDGHAVFLTHIMHPGEAGVQDFDLIAVPGHDRQDNPFKPLNRPHLIWVTGAPHRLNEQVLIETALAHKDLFDGLPRPFMTVLLGGPTKHGPFTEEEGRVLGQKANALAEETGGSVLLATARRTGPSLAQAVTAQLSVPHLTTRYGIDPENLYLPFLAASDAVVVTGDSVSMVSEACATQAPVYIYVPNKAAAAKHLRFHRELYDQGYARPFDGVHGEWTHAPLNPAFDIATAIKSRRQETP